MSKALRVGLVVLFLQIAGPFVGLNSFILGGETLEAQPLRVCLNNNNGMLVARPRCRGARFSPVSQDLLTALSPTVQGEQGPQGPQGLPGIAEFVKLSPGDKIDIGPQSSIGPHVVGNSVDIGDISPYRGLLVEWAVFGAHNSNVMHQFVYLSDQDKQGIIDGTETIKYDFTFPANSSHRSHVIGFSMAGTRLWVSSFSLAYWNTSGRIIRVYGFK